MREILSVQRFFGVEFRFLSDDPDECARLSGTVAMGAETCVLEIPGGDGPYLINGQDQGGWYQGCNADLKANRVTAAWARLGDEFVGVWREEGQEWLFSFQLPGTG